MRTVLIAVAVGLQAPGNEWVGRARLRSVQSVECLERLQQNPHDSCAPKPRKVVADTAAAEGDAWSIGHFPKPLIPELQGGDPRCGAHGELLCDPDGVLTAEDQKDFARTLQMFRENSMVHCRLPFLRHMDTAAVSSPREEDEHQFRVGVAVLESLPPSMLDDHALDVFGEYLLSTWNIAPHDCGAGAVIILVTAAEKAWITAPSCEYVCGQDLETGGRVLNALEQSLDWRAIGGARGGRTEALGSGDYKRALENALHELEDVMHEHRGMAFANGHAVVMPKPDTLWRMRKEREWSDVAPLVEGLTVLAVGSLFGYMAHWYTVRFYGEYLYDLRVAFKSLQSTG